MIETRYRTGRPGHTGALRLLCLTITSAAGCFSGIACCVSPEVRQTACDAAMTDIPTEMQKVSIPPYRVETPDILSIEAVNNIRPASDLLRAGDELIIDERQYHTIKESKNGQGPAPLKTPRGWLHIAHGVRNTAAGLRYVLYAFLSDLSHPERVTHRPGGYLLAPIGEERVGDVSNVLFCNGAVARQSGEILIYYASSDTRLHVATTTVDKMLDYVLHTPPDPMRSFACVEQRHALIKKNLDLIARVDDPLLRGART
jgi:hypothetical protein